MSNRQPRGMLPSGSGMTSPSSQLAAFTFNPFEEDDWTSGSLLPRAPDPRNSDPFQGFITRATQAGQQGRHSGAAMVPSGSTRRSRYQTSSDSTYGGPPARDARQEDLVSPTCSPAQVRTIPSASRANGRRFLVQNVSTDIEGLDIIKQFPEHAYPSMIGPYMVDLSTKGRFYIGFSDLREANCFLAKVVTLNVNWDITVVSPEVFNRETRLCVSVPLNFDDSVLVTLYCVSDSNVNPQNIVDKVKPILDLLGTVHSIQELHLSHPSEGRITVHDIITRYFNASNALNAIRALNSVRNAEFIIEVVPYIEGTENQTPRHWSISNKARREEQQAVQAAQPVTPARRAYMSPGHDPDSSPIPIPERGPVGNTQKIDLSHVLHQRDPRTTIMLRNIPAAMTWPQLKAILDSTSRNRYDFMYLRMDFNSNQNVGYAFVNFATPVEIYKFMNARQGHAWPGFLRFEDKIAVMSYATVQGKSALVEKFRNSPVMLNSEDHRPKLFHMDGLLIGRQAPFPPVNNFYALSRAIERSQKTGLYRSGARTDPRNYLYPDRAEMAQRGMPAGDGGSPIRAARGQDTGAAAAFRAAEHSLQRWLNDPSSG